MTDTAIFAAGCFWGVEQDFRSLKGVADVAVGYTGGSREQPTYEEVCSGNSGHAEAVLVTFDSQEISYDELLDAFFRMHDPTQLNRQGWDVGSEYRSAIFYTDESQRALAVSAVSRWQPQFKRSIVTQVVEASTFWRAEEYHQRYLQKRGVTSCRI